MPVNKFGQMITFAIHRGGDQRFSGYTYTRAPGHVKKIRLKPKQAKKRKRKFGYEWVGAKNALQIAANRGDPHMAFRICDLNNIRGIRRKLKPGRRIRIPDRLRGSAQFNVLAGDNPPTITDGYAKINTIDRGQRTGLSTFVGYNPMVLRVPVRFEATDREGNWLDASGAQIEKDIKLLEQMAGRGQFQGEGVGSPPIIKVTTTGAKGNYLSLIPDSLQKQRPGAAVSTLWWISGIEWDEDALRNDVGNRLRQLAVIELTEYVKPAQVTASAAARHKAKKTKPPHRRSRSNKYHYHWPNGTWHSKPYRGK